MHPVPPLASHSLLVFFAAIAVLLAVARLLGRLAERIGMPAIVGELATGVILGPSLLLHVLPGVSHWLFPADANQMHLLDGIAQVGAVLLVGVTGTQLDLGLLRRTGGTALTVSGLNLITPLALGVTLGLFLPATVVASGHTSRVVLALFIGVTMCVSAIPVIAKTLSDMRLLHRNPGQLILAAGSIDDAVGWLLLSVVSAAATTGVRTGHVLVAVAYLIAFVLLAGTVGRVGVKKVLTVTTRADEPGPTVAAAVVIILAGAVTTAALGMEPIFGAFIAGTVISASRIAQRQLAALRTLVLSVLAPLFLATAGLRVDVTVLDALLLDKGFTGSRFAAEMADAGIEVIIPPTRAQRATMPKTLQRLIARLRNRVETSFKEITDQMELARHGAHTFEGLLTRTAAVLAAHTLLFAELFIRCRTGVPGGAQVLLVPQRASLAADLLRPARAPVPVPAGTARLAQAAQGDRAPAGRAWLDRAPRGRNETGNGRAATTSTDHRDGATRTASMRYPPSTTAETAS